MKRRIWPTLALALLLSLFPFGSSADPDDGYMDESALLSAIRKNGGGEKAGQVQNNGEIKGLTLIAHNDIGGRGFNADIWAHKGFAYIGQWGYGDASHPETCPSGDNSGVKILDLAKPGIPVVATLQNPPRTSAEDVWVYTARYGPLKDREIAAVGIQACFRTDATIKRGLQLFDVTNPRKPKELGFYDSGMAARGIHEFSVTQRADLGRTLAYVSVPLSETRDLEHDGDFRVIDITDPRTPVELSTWGLVVNSAVTGVTSQFSGVGCYPYSYVHGAEASTDGRTAFTANFDGGLILLDVTDPSAPRYLRRAQYAAGTDGDIDTHSAIETPDSRFLLVQDEDDCFSSSTNQQAGWGHVRIFDLGSQDANGNLVQVGEFKTAHSLQAKVSRGYPTAHNSYVNPAWSSRKVAVSWYSDGVRIIDLSSVYAGQRSPTEIAYFVPPAAKDPVHVLEYSANVWGVVVTDDGLVIISDMNSGVWVLRESAP